MTAPPAALRGQDPDRWARRAAIGFGCAIVASFLVPMHRATLEHFLWVRPDAMAGEWNWAWNWLPRVVPRQLGPVLAFSASGVLALALAARRKREGLELGLLACGLATVVAWAIFNRSSRRAPAWGEVAWNSALPPIWFAFAWGGARLRLRHPDAPAPRILCLLGSLGLLAYLVLPIVDEPLLAAVFNRSGERWLWVRFGLSLALVVAGLASSRPVPWWPRAHAVTGLIACGVAIAIPASHVLEVRGIVLDRIEPEMWSRMTDGAWFTLTAFYVLVCAGALGLGSVGLAAFVDGRLVRGAAPTDRAELDDVFE